MIYVTMVQDRHMDTEPYLFSTLEKAMVFAKGIIEDYAHQFGSRLNQTDEVLTEEELAERGWLFTVSRNFGYWSFGMACT